MEEISTSFCFICLLHLANEQGLQINDLPKESAPLPVEPDDDDDDSDERRERVVGNIWGLKVCHLLLLTLSIKLKLHIQIYRDPDVTPSA